MLALAVFAVLLADTIETKSPKRCDESRRVSCGTASDIIIHAFCDIADQCLFDVASTPLGGDHGDFPKTTEIVGVDDDAFATEHIGVDPRTMGTASFCVGFCLKKGAEFGH